MENSQRHVCFVEASVCNLTQMAIYKVCFCLLRENLQGGVPPTADVLSAEVHRSDLGSTVEMLWLICKLSQMIQSKCPGMGVKTGRVCFCGSNSPIERPGDVFYGPLTCSKTSAIYGFQPCHHQVSLKDPSLQVF